MTGHRQIIEARIKGKKPGCVFVEYGENPLPIDHECCHPEKQILVNQPPVVYMEEDELPDMRFLVGLNVHFHCEGITQEVRKLVKKMISYKPARLVFSDIKDGHFGIWQNGEWKHA